MSVTATQLRASAKALVRLLEAEGKTLSTAESCTGGLIAKSVTDIAGSSAVFCGACVTYTNEMKIDLLGVDPTLIERESEVSLACACAMAEGVKCRLHTDLAVSTTGYAGPGGGTEADPVGTVYVGLSSVRGTRAFRFSAPAGANRAQVRNAAALFALELLKKEITGEGIFGE